MKKKWYTIYCAKTDEIVACGGASACAKQMGRKSVDSFYCLVSRAQKGKIKKYVAVVDK